MWEIWMRFFLDCLNKHAPITQLKVKGNHMPYVTSKLRSLIRTRDYLKTKAVKTGSSFIRQAFIQLRGSVYSLLQKSRNDYYTKRINENKGNMKSTWKILKHAIGIENKDSTVEILNSEGQQISNTCEIVEAFNEHFVKVGKRLVDEIPQSVCSLTANIDKANTRFEFMEISASNIVKVIKKLISGKATGLYGIPNKALKDSAELIASSLSDLFNFSIGTKTYPDDFKVAKVTPIFKSGDKDDVNNYRLISIIPTIARVFEKLIYNQLYQYFVNNKLLSNQQFGFRSLHSTALALSKATNQWLLSLDKGCMDSVVFLDIEKAFDTVDHQILSDKLRCYGIHDEELKFFQSYLYDRAQCCQVKGISPTIKIYCGVPQAQY